jgi:hypothetical protein
MRKENPATVLAMLATMMAAALAVSTTLLLIGPERYERWQAKRRAAKAEGTLVVAPSPTARVIPEVFRDVGPPPTENPQCVQDVLQKYYPTLKWNGFSWVDSADPAPPANSEAAAAWRGRMSVKAGGAAALFSERSCDKPPAQAAQPGSQAPAVDPKAELLGTYYLRAKGTPPPECQTVLPAKLTALAFQSATEFNLRLEPQPGTSDSPRGDFSGVPINGYTFRLNVPGKYFSVEGTFLGQSGGTIIEGTFSYNVGGGCGIEYVGTKTPPAP